MAPSSSTIEAVHASVIQYFSGVSKTCALDDGTDLVGEIVKIPVRSPPVAD